MANRTGGRRRASVARRMLMLAVFATAMLGASAPARAELVTVTGGEAILEVNLSTVQAMANEHIYTSVLAPATIKYSLPNPEATFPITGGTVESDTLLGTVDLGGGLRLQKCGVNCDDVQQQLDTTNLRILNGNMLLGDTAGLIPTPQFDLANATWTQDPSGTIYYDADVNMNAGAAIALNLLFSTSVFQPGLNLGHFRVTINPVPYQVPQSAEFMSYSLVPSARQCGTGANPPDGQHSPPLGVESCSPVQPTSSVASAGPQSSGTAIVNVLPGDPNSTINEADVEFNVEVSDVRQGSPTGPDYDPNPAGADLTAEVRQRITDKRNSVMGGAERAPGTTTDLNFSIPLDCAGDGDSSFGSFCGTYTTANALLPGTVTELRQSIVQYFRIRVNDSGPNGIRGDGDDTLFQQQGVYIP